MVMQFEPSDALKQLMKRASHGEQAAQCELGCCYKEGDGLEKDEAAAVWWWSLAAAQGMAEAEYLLAVACFFGEGVAKDPTRAFKLCCLAADQSHADAIYKLGVMYMQGIATPKDPIAAKALYVYATSLGSKHAKIPDFEIGEASRALMLATLMGQSGKVLNTLAAWRQNKADAAAAEDKYLESEDVGVSMAQSRSAREAATRIRWHIGHAAMLLGTLGLIFLLGAWLLMPHTSPMEFGPLAAFLLLARIYGVWRTARDFRLSGRITSLLVVVSVLPIAGLLVCTVMLFEVFRRRVV